MVSLVFVAIQIVRKRTKFSLPHVLIGWVRGAANFCNILFYLKAHQTMSTQPSAVFSAMNVGVITLGTLVGLLVFNEKLSHLNNIGIFLALVSIIVVANA